MSSPKTLGALAFALVAACGGSTSSGTPSPAKAPSGRIYVTVYGEDAVAVIDTATHAVLDPIALGSGKGPAILLKTPDGSKLYAANWKGNSLSSIDVATSAVHEIPLGSRPWVEAMGPQGDVVYAGLNAKKIAVVRTSDDTIVRSLDVGGLLPESIVVSPDGATLYVAVADESNPLSLLGAGAIEAISASTGAVTHPAIQVGKAPAWITISPDGSKVYTLDFLSDDVSVIDTATWAVTATIPLPAGSEPIIGGVTPAGLLVVTNFGTDDISVIDPATHQVVHKLATDGRPVGVEFSPDGKLGYATNFGHASASIAPDPLSLISGNLASAIGSGPGQLVVFDAVTGAAVGDPIVVPGAGPTSVVAE